MDTDLKEHVWDMARKCGVEDLLDDALVLRIMHLYQATMDVAALLQEKAAAPSQTTVDTVAMDHLETLIEGMFHASRIE